MSDISIADLARLTGLAKSTVSGVLNNKPGFSEKTRRKVLAAAAQYGYVPNEIARGLTSKLTKTIGLVIKDITNPFYSRITKGVQEIAGEHGYTVFLCSSGEQHEAELAQIQAMIARRVDGLIIAPLLEGVPLEHLHDLKRKGLPFALLGSVPGLACDCVTFDDYGGGRAVTAYVIGQGHTRIGFVAGLKTSRASKLRHAAFKDQLLEHGLTLDSRYMFSEAASFQDGVRIGEQLARQSASERPTALICFDDVIAMGVIRGAQSCGMNVPDDLSVTGFDDIDLMAVPLTTVSVPTYEAGKTLARLLFERIFDEDAGSEYRQVGFEEHLVIRETVAVRAKDGT